jgi:hypothetical protein
MRIVVIMKQRVAHIGMDDTLETCVIFLPRAFTTYWSRGGSSRWASTPTWISTRREPFLGSGSENQRDRDTLLRGCLRYDAKPVTISPQGTIARPAICCWREASLFAGVEKRQVVARHLGDLLRASTCFITAEKS